MKYVIIAINKKTGKEEWLDARATMIEAIRLIPEYQAAYGSNFTIDIKMRII